MNRRHFHTGIRGFIVLEAEQGKTDCAAKLKVLAEGTRLAVMKLLMNSPKHVGRLNEELGIDQSLLSHHLRVLREAGFVEAIRDGKSMLYRLAPEVEVADQKRGIDLGCCQLSFDEHLA